MVTDAPDNVHINVDRVKRFKLRPQEDKITDETSLIDPEFYRRGFNVRILADEQFQLVVLPLGVDDDQLRGKFSQRLAESSKVQGGV